MRARLGLAALALAMLTWGVCRVTSERGARGAPQEESVEVAAEAKAAPIVSAPVELERKAVEVGEPAPAPPRPSEAQPQVEEGAATRRLRGVLVHSSDRRPAPSAVLGLDCGTEIKDVVTDADGRFETDVLPGGVRVWHKGDLPDPLWAERLPVRPETFLVSGPPGGDEPAEVELALADPAAWLEVEVVTLSGIPAQADLSWFFRPAENAGLPLSGGDSPTDAAGRARLPYPGVQPGSRMTLRARGKENLVSDSVTVEPPLAAEPVRLVLDLGGTIRALVIGKEGEPLSGEAVSLVVAEAQIFETEFQETTDAAGAATFSSVPPGRYRLIYWHEEASLKIEAEAEVERGTTVEVELRVAGLPLAVAGRVVDGEGRAVRGVTIDVAIAEARITTETDEYGVFSVESAERGRVRLMVPPDPWSERYEPAELEVPFGTRDLLIRQRESRPTTSLTLEILEARTRAPVPGALVLSFVEPRRSSWSFHRAPAGVAAFELKLHHDVGLAVEAVGYRRRIFRAAELARETPPGEPCRVLLEPGLERSLLIVDEESEEPLAGARVLDAERLVATSDRDGRAEIDLPAWPLELRIRADGHADAVWNCKDWLSELGEGTVLMERIPEPDAPR
jgi:hypothetical protein